MNNSNPFSAKQARQLPIETVDNIVNQLMDDLGAEPRFKSWYCGVVYEFGVERVHYWQVRVKESDCPAKLFSKLVVQHRARNTREKKSVISVIDSLKDFYGIEA